MKTPTLKRGHRYHEQETRNTWQFALYNNRGRVLVQYSIQKHLKEHGAFTFWQKVADLYDALQQQSVVSAKISKITKTHRKKDVEAAANAVFAQVDFEQQNLHSDLHKQSQSDFLGKIKRVSLPV